MFALTALASAIVTSVATGPVDAWPILAPPDGRFTVRMPGPVDESTDTVETDASDVVRHTFNCSTNQVLWQLSYVDLPTSLTLKRSDDEILRAAQSGARTMDRMKIFAEGGGKLGQMPWKRYRVEIPDGPVVSNYLLLDHKRLYHLLVVSPPHKFRHVGVKEFFSSFSPKASN